MFFIKYRPYIIVLAIIIAIYMHVTEGLYIAIYFYLVTFLMVGVELFIGNSVLAFNLLKRGSPEVAAEVLGKTWVPSLLIKSRKAYYHFTRGILALQVKDLDGALYDLDLANTLGLKTSLDSALNALNLAHIYFAKKDKLKTIEFLDKAKSYQLNDLMLKEKITEMERALKKMRK